MNDDCVGRRIFQTWKSKTDIPDDFAYWRSTVMEKNRDFSFTLWDDGDNRKFIAEFFPWFLPIYDQFPAEIYRADAVRYFYLYKNGGFYIDMDTECLSPLDKFAGFEGILLGRMGPNPDFAHSVPNAIMASRPREEFWLLLISLIASSFHIGLRGAEALTGPIPLKSATDIYLSKEPLMSSQMIGAMAKYLPGDLKPRATRSSIKLLPPKEWYPIDWSDPVHAEFCQMQGSALLSEDQKKRLFPASSLVTYWSHTWTEPEQYRGIALQLAEINRR